MHRRITTILVQVSAGSVANDPACLPDSGNTGRSTRGSLRVTPLGQNLYTKPFLISSLYLLSPCIFLNISPKILSRLRAVATR